MAQGGWIKLHRKITDWEWYSDMPTRSVFLHLLLVAEFEACERKGVIIERGQALITLRELGATLGISLQQTRTAINNIQKSKQITIKSTNKFSVITVVNYDTYQDEERSINTQNNTQSTHKTTHNQHTKQHTSYKKEEKKERSEESKNASCVEPPSASTPPPPAESPVFLTFLLNDSTEFAVTERMVSEFSELYPAVDVRQEVREMKAWCFSNPKRRKTRSGAMTFINKWLSKEQNNPKNNGVNHANNGTTRSNTTTATPPRGTGTPADFNALAHSWGLQPTVVSEPNIR